MSNYDNYSPEIDSYDDSSSLTYTAAEDSSAVQATESSASRRRRRGRANKTDNSVKEVRRLGTKAESKKISSRSKGTETTWINKFREIVLSPTFRVLSGIFLIFLATYLGVAIIAFLRDGFIDQSEIEATSVGVAQGIVNPTGEGGARISSVLVSDGFGLGAIVIVFWLVMVGLKLLTNSRKPRFKVVNFTIKCLIALITISLIIGLCTISLDAPFNLGGNHGRYVNQFIIDFIGWVGAVLLCVFMIAIFIGICLNDVVQWCLRKKRERDAIKARKAELKALEEEKKRQMQEMERQDMIDQALAGDHIMSQESESSEDEKPSNVSFDENGNQIESKQEDNLPMLPDEDYTTYVYEEEKEKIENNEEANQTDVESNDLPEMKVNINQIGTTDSDDKDDIIDPRQDLPNYHFPPTSILKPGKEKVSLDQEEQLENQRRIRATLLDFGIPITSIEATVGPTVTLYEIIPENGVKIAKIRNLQDDIALKLAAKGVRIIAPIPGRGTVGIEVPNKDPQIVSMRTILSSNKYKETHYDLPLAIGSTISNDVYIADLAKMPHLLVAGATGQGKSVGLNAIITSLLYRKHPAELKFVLVDPKMVEFSLYSSLEHHYLAKLPGEQDAIITDIPKVVPTLSSLCVEMDQRYELLKSAMVRNIKEYNEKFLSKHLSVRDGHRFLPYIVVIVDEFGDLKMTAGKEVEVHIARLAQKSRAVGIHLILATQRPSTDVITGIIKANFPARIAFKVSSGVDSKTILNSTSACQLIGKGDMLISNNSELVRVQCAFIDTPEVEDVCACISQQPGFETPYLLPEPLPTGNEGDDSTGLAFGDRDPLFDEIARVVVSSNTASTSSLQRRYSIGYNRAGKIMDQMEAAGIVGPSQGGKPRSVLIDSVTLEAMLNSK
jgi:S-DNA-T family DNA segregation ATPase FtsK/SpoIIIE